MENEFNLAGDNFPATGDENSASDCESGITDTRNSRRRKIFGESIVVEVPETDRSYEIIRRKLLAGFGDAAVVTAIHRRNWSENSTTRARIQSFQIHAKAMEKNCGGNPNMKFGWYGGDKDRIHRILARGFSYSDLKIDNDGVILLSSDNSPSPSLEDSGADEDGLRHVLLCRVILGRSELVQFGSGQIHPSSNEFDSGVDSYDNPKKYVIWSTNMNTHILPEYVVTFQVKACHSLSAKEVVSKMKSGIIRMPTSPWISFPALISILSKYLVKDATTLITKYHKDYKERKIPRAELIQKVRQIAGDKLLISVIKSFKGSKMSSSDEESVVNEVKAKKANIVKCRSRKLVTLMNGFNEAKRAAVRRVGFGGLLEMSFKKYPLDNVHHFVDAFKDQSYVFRASNVKEFMISKHDVHDCFLLPLGPNDLKLVATGPKRDENEEQVRSLKDRWRAEFRITKPGHPIPVGKLAAAISADVEGGDRFIRMFVVYCMSSFLCPTLNGSVDLKLLAAVEDVSSIRNFDWCTYVLDGLVEATHKASTDATCLGGCIPFLMITYFHRFDFRGRSSPSDLPLIKHWTNDKLKVRIKGELLGGSLGRQTWSSVHYPRCTDPSYAPSHMAIEEVPPGGGPDVGEEQVVREDHVQPMAGTEGDRVGEQGADRTADTGIPDVTNSNINEPVTYIQVRLPPGLDDDNKLHAKATDPLHALYMKMQRNSIAFHAWYTETAAKIKEYLTAAAPIADINLSQSTQAFFEDPALHRYVDEIVDTSRRMKVSTENAPKLQPPSTTQVQQVLDDLAKDADDDPFYNTGAGLSPNHSTSNAADYQSQRLQPDESPMNQDQTLHPDESPLRDAFIPDVEESDLYTTAEVAAVMNSLKEASSSKDLQLVPLQEQPDQVHPLAIALACCNEETTTPTTSVPVICSQSNTDKRQLQTDIPSSKGKRPRLSEDETITPLAVRKVCRFGSPHTLSVIRSRSRGRGDGLGCTLDCGAPNSGKVVSSYMRNNAKNTSEMASLKRRAADYCFLNDYVFDLDEILADYGNDDILRRSDLLSLIPENNVTPAVIQCWCKLLNYIESSDFDIQRMAFFGLRHMDILMRILETDHEASQLTPLIDQLYENWDEQVKNCGNTFNLHAELLFVPIHVNDHYSSVCVNFKDQTIDILDNTYPININNSSTTYNKAANFISMTISDYIESRGLPKGSDIINFKRREINFPWKEKQPNDPESGLFTMMQLVLYEGCPIEDNSLARKMHRRYLVAQLAATLMLSDINRVRGQLLDKLSEFNDNQKFIEDKVDTIRYLANKKAKIAKQR